MQTTDSSVSALIITFTRSLDYFKNLSEQRRKQKTLKVNKKKDALRGDELKLSMSLRQGPVEIQREYERNYRANGDRYAVGDPIASASLARAIRRLNAGLLSIISSFLSCGEKEKTQLDYKYLTSVSELSRQEAVEALSQLNTRLSRSALSLHDEQRRCTHPTEKRRPRKLTSPDSKVSLKATARLPKQTSRDAKEMRAPEVRRIQMRDSSQPELAIVRPRARRTKSSLSVSTKGSSTPPPAYSPLSTPGFSHHSHAPSAIPNPYTWAPLSPGHRRQVPDHEGLIVLPPYPLSPLPPCTENLEEIAEFVPYACVPAVQRRRAEKLTPRMYTTFIKASTNLGEIPMSRWNRPWDTEEMDKKNEEMKDRTWARDTGFESSQRKRGWWRLFSGGNGAI
ncbi:hypothetical protein BLS_004526 [Venturia inaequalis]|uniref:Uncharacterized protein n=1 Tax=Venturia inaequalis TaxID=5025 RepID=A0A8H3VC66_VENIN|nr:hypothetical protein BLS_004526 [Venturia inaequalis]